MLGSLILYNKGMRVMMFQLSGFYCIVNPKKLETALRTNNAGIPYTLLLRVEATGFPIFGLLPYSHFLGFYHIHLAHTVLCCPD